MLMMQNANKGVSKLRSYIVSFLHLPQPSTLFLRQDGDLIQEYLNSPAQNTPPLQARLEKRVEESVFFFFLAYVDALCLCWWLNVQ